MVFDLVQGAGLELRQLSKLDILHYDLKKNTALRTGFFEGGGLVMPQDKKDPYYNALTEFFHTGKLKLPPGVYQVTAQVSYDLRESYQNSRRLQATAEIIVLGY